MKPLGILIFATGSDMYTNLACDLINSLRHNFPAHEPILFTEKKLPVRATIIDHPDLGWPRASLMRYHYILKHEILFSEYRQILYMDADMLPVTRVSMEELRTDGLLAVVHPGYPDAFERSKDSTACVVGDHEYYQGCIQGGETQTYLRAAREMARNIDIDDEKGVKAACYDESHWNKYLVDHKPSLVLPPSFAFPGAKYIRGERAWPRMRGVVPRVRHIDKNLQREW